MIEAAIWIDPVTLTQVHPDEDQPEYGTVGSWHRDWGFVAALEFKVGIGPILGGIDIHPWVPGTIANWHRAQPQQILANLYEGWDHELGAWPPYRAAKYPYGNRLIEAAHYATLDAFSRVLRDTWKDSIVTQMREANRVLYGEIPTPRRLDWWDR